MDCSSEHGHIPASLCQTVSVDCKSQRACALSHNINVIRRSNAVFTQSACW